MMLSFTRYAAEKAFWAIEAAGKMIAKRQTIANLLIRRTIMFLTLYLFTAFASIVVLAIHFATLRQNLQVLPTRQSWFPLARYSKW